MGSVYDAYRLAEGKLEMAAMGTHEKVAQLINRYIPDVSGMQCLDLPCGKMAFTKVMASAGATVFAVDIVPVPLQSSLPENIVPLVLDANEPFKLQESMDFVVSIEGIEHLTNISVFLKSIEGCLKPGGLFFMTTPNVDNIGSRLKFFLHGYHRHFDPSGTEWSGKASGHTLPMDMIFLTSVAKIHGLEFLDCAVNDANNDNWLARILRPIMTSRLPKIVSEKVYYGKVACYVFRKESQSDSM